MNKVENKDNYAFYAGKLDESEVERRSKNHELYEFGTDLLDGQVSFSAFGDDLKVSGSGKIVEDPHPLLRVDLNKPDKAHMHKVAQSTDDDFLKDNDSVLLTRIKVSCDRHKYVDKTGKERTFKRYGVVPVFANSYTAKKLLLRFATGDRISFTGGFYSTVLTDEDGNYTNKATFYIVLRTFEGYPVVRKQRLLDMKLKNLARPNKQTSTKPKTYQRPTENKVADSDKAKEETPMPTNTNNRKEENRRENYRRTHQPVIQPTESNNSRETKAPTSISPKTTNKGNGTVANAHSAVTEPKQETTTSQKNTVVTVGDDDLKLDF